MTKNTAKTASKANTAKENEKPAEITAEHKALVGKIVQIVVPENKRGPKGFKDGEQVDCIAVSVTRRFNKPTARVIRDGKMNFIDPKWLRPVKAIAAAKLALLQAEQEERSKATILIPAVCVDEREKAVLLSYSGWYSGVWFPKSLITRLADHPTDKQPERAVWEVPLWKIQNKGQDCIDKLQSMQEELSAIADGETKAA